MCVKWVACKEHKKEIWQYYPIFIFIFLQKCWLDTHFKQLTQNNRGLQVEFQFLKYLSSFLTT